MLSVNENAYSLVGDLCEAADKYAVSVEVDPSGTTLIDAGINVRGGLAAGRMVTEICMGGLGGAQISQKSYSSYDLLSILVHTDHPAIATLGSQFAGWQIKRGDFFAIGSGPARALALKPHEIYDTINYQDKSERAILVLETAKRPPLEIIEGFSSECKVQPDQLYIVLVPTTSLAGSTQVSGRIVETGLHKLSKIGINPLTVHYACGQAPIAPVHPKFATAMGMTNDVILYGGVAYYALEHDDDDTLRAILKQAPSSASKQYGKPFREIFKEANHDFYQVDPNLFAPAKFILNNLTTGSTFQVGEINPEILSKSLKLSEL
jgi:methenyltetrahydromethanopterin cyclohydrolase